jgi:aminobenzoyl-glutamate utilization protein B
MQKNSEQIWQYVEDHSEAFTELSDRVWDTPELLFEEHLSVAAHTAELQRYGFRLTENVAGIPTAVMGEAGEGGPVIAILGEYDALPGLSQEAGMAEPRPLAAGASGHACGHNLLGAGALLAAVAVKQYLENSGLKGRVRYYGCPAEEGGAAKGFMVRSGIFNDVDIAMTWHPANFTSIIDAQSLANMFVDFTFNGRASHASSSPHLGRSALDAAELMNVGVNYLREHMPSDTRIHYAYLDAGGIAANVVQASATLRYVVRAPELREMRSLLQRVRQIATGAALMTETTVTDKVLSAMSNLVGNTPLEEAMYRSLSRVGPPPFDATDRGFAEAIRQTLTDADIDASFRRVGLAPQRPLALHDGVIPLDCKAASMNGSTDLGDVSWVVPTVWARVATQAIGTQAHTWQVTAQGKSAMAHKGMVTAAKAMAGLAAEALLDPSLIASAKADFASRVGAAGYVCPIPDDVEPPVQGRSDIRG